LDLQSLLGGRAFLVLERMHRGLNFPAFTVRAQSRRTSPIFCITLKNFAHHHQIETWLRALAGSEQNWGKCEFGWWQQREWVCRRDSEFFSSRGTPVAEMIRRFCRPEQVGHGCTKF
jgi:hypothetical protein